MLDYYLKFTSQEEAFSALKEAGYTQIFDGKETIKTATHEYCIDEVGTIYENGEVGFDNEGKLVIINPPTQLEGWHINIRMIRGDISENLLPFVISTPQTPYRTFA